MSDSSTPTRFGSPGEAAAGLTASGSRVLRIGWYAIGRGLIGFYDSNNFTYAAAIAYYTLAALFPFVLLMLSLVSHITISQSDATLLDLIAATLPRNFDFLVNQIQELGRAPLNLSVAGVLVTLVASISVFGAVTSAVNHAWGVEKAHGFLKHKWIAFLMLVAAGLLMLAALLIVGVVHVVEAKWFAGVVVQYPQLARLQGLVFHLLPTGMFIVVVGLIYYAVPNARVQLRDVWFGAVVAGLLWRLSLWIFGWYVNDLSRFSVHGSAAAVVVFLLWVYLSAVILLYGAEVSAAYARLRGRLARAAERRAM